MIGKTSLPKEVGTIHRTISIVIYCFKHAFDVFIFYRSIHFL